MKGVGAVAISLLLTACAAAPAIVSATDYRNEVARALDHYTGQTPPKRYFVSEPFISLAGGDMAVCVKKDLVDTKGRHIETDARTIYIFEGGRLRNEMDGSNASVCRIKDYSELAPIPRPTT